MWATVGVRDWCAAALTAAITFSQVMLVAATFYMSFGSVCYVAFGEATSDQILGTIM